MSADPEPPSAQPGADHPVVITVDPGYTAWPVSWSCQVCDWSGSRLPSERAARREHAHIAREIASGEIPPPSRKRRRALAKT